MPYRAVIFDLDGTLLNTLDDIADSANAVLDELGFPTHTTDAYRFFVGGGVTILFEKALPERQRNRHNVAACVERFRHVYEQGWDIKTCLYDGVAELLDELAKRRLRMAVLSNKPHAFTEKSVAKYLSNWPISPVLGQRDGIPHKPDPKGALEIAERLQLAPTDFLYLGDTGTDMKTARAATMFAVGAAWGFRPERELDEAGAEAIIRKPADLLRVIDGSELSSA